MIQPLPNENYEHFIIRAHKALMDHVPDFNERNRVVWDAWQESRGPTEAESIAAAKFPEEKYQANPKVCVFGEHETIGSDGKPVTYGALDMAKIARCNNRRIVDVDSFGAISDGHTNPENPFAPQPDVLGYSGPYHMGMIGRVKPRWALFSDEHHDRTKRPRIEALPRRSVELLKFKNTGDMIFDPVAALGSNAPRLPLPGQYSADTYNGVTVERYQALSPNVGAASYPGGSNTYVKTQKFSAEKNAMMSDEDIAQITDALAQTPQFQFMDQLMNNPNVQAMLEDVPQSEAVADESGATLPNVEAEEYMGADDPAMEEKDEYQAMGDTSDLDALIVAGKGEAGIDPEQNMAKPKQHMGRSHYSAGNSQGAATRQPVGAGAQSLNGSGPVTLDQYNALRKSHNSLIQQHSDVLKRTTAIERQGADGNRRAELQALATRCPGVVDLDEELSQCLYSLGANMSDAQFTAHLATVEKYASRAQPASIERIPTGEMPDQVSADRYQAQSELAVEIHTELTKKGETKGWDELMQLAGERLGK